MDNVIDARGFSCPQPVLMTKHALKEKKGAFSILVSGAEQAENVQMFIQRNGCTSKCESIENGFMIHVEREKSNKPVSSTFENPPVSGGGSLVLSVPSRHMGSETDEELGDILIRALFHTLTESDVLPDTIVFYNSGVKLAVEGSPVLEDLSVLQEKGIRILVCGTCLGYFNLTKDIRAGRVSNMYDIAETLLQADRTVSI